MGINYTGGVILPQGGFTTQVVKNPTWVSSGNLGSVDGNGSFSSTIYAEPGYANEVVEYRLVGDVPSGLSIDPTTGLISGTPANTGRIHNFVAKAEVDTNIATSLPLTLEIINSAPAWTTPAGGLLTAYKGLAYSTSITANDPNNDTVSFVVSAGVLPTGVTLSSNGAFTGTPTSLGIHNFTVAATDPLLGTTNRNFFIQVNDPAVTWSTASGSIGSVAGLGSFSLQLDATPGKPGDTMTYAVQSGSLPSGITVSTSGLVSGTASNTLGTFSFSVRATSSSNTHADQSFSISVTNTPPNWNTASGALTAAIQNQSYSVSLSATDPNGDTVSYSLVSGSLPTGLSLSNGTISGTPTVAATANFTVRADDGRGGQTDRNFTIATQAGEPYWDKVLLLVDFEDGFTDVSPKNLSVGTNSLTRFSSDKKFGSWSAGSTNNSYVWMSYPTDAITGDFTVEMWVKPTKYGSPVWCAAPYTSYIDGNGKFTLNDRDGPWANHITGTTTISTTQWTHLAIVRNSGVITLYVNGIAEGTPWSNSATVSAGTTIGWNGYNGDGYYAGLFDDYRITNAARYTSNFTPSNQTYPRGPIFTTISLPNAGVGVSYHATIIATNAALLEVTNGTLPAGLSINTSTGVISGTPTAATTAAITVRATTADGITIEKNFSLNVVQYSVAFDFENNVTDSSGNTTVSASNVTYSQNNQTGNYAISFDGSSSTLLQSGTSNHWKFAGDFTIEMWIYPTSGGYGVLLENRSSSAGSATGVGIHVSGTQIGGHSDGGGSIFPWTTALTLNKWQHFAVCRSGTTVKAFIDGAVIATKTNVTANFSDGCFSLGYSPSHPNKFAGMIDGLKVVNNSALYTSAFVVGPTWPTSPSSLNGVVNYPVSVSLGATNAVSYSIVNGSLPTGWSLNSTTGVVSGTSSSTLGATTITIGATDSSGRTVNRTFPISVTDYSVKMLFENNFTDSMGTVTATNSNVVSSNLRYGTGNYSGYFNGSARLDTASTTAVNFGTGDFTVEGWINFAVVQNFYMLSNSSFVQSALWVGYENGAWKAGKHNVAYIFTYTHTPTPGTWYHFAVTREGGAMRMFLNGTLVASANDSFDCPAYGLAIGGQNGQPMYLNGFMDDFAIIKGAAKYTATFTPVGLNNNVGLPASMIGDSSYSTNGAQLSGGSSYSILTGTLPAGLSIDSSTGVISGTATTAANSSFTVRAIVNGSNVDRAYSLNVLNYSMLLHFENNLTDTTGNVSFTNSGTTFSNTNYKYGSYAASFNGSARIYSTTSEAVHFANNDFTVETWVRFNTVGNSMVITNESYVGGSLFLQYYNGQWFAGQNGGGWTLLHTHTPTANTWYHVALVRKGTVATLYLNGTAVATNSCTANFPAYPITIGGQSGNLWLNGQLDEMAIINGVAKYSGNFTPTQIG